MSINVGIPGPQVRSRCQDPVLLEDVLIDFPGLTIVGAHMGHPYEALLIQYMLKWPQLHVMTSAYLATYMDPADREVHGLLPGPRAGAVGLGPPGDPGQQGDGRGPHAAAVRGGHGRVPRRFAPPHPHRPPLPGSA